MPRAKTDNVRINVFVDPKVLKGLKWLAKRRGSTYSEQLRMAAREFVTREITREKESA